MSAIYARRKTHIPPQGDRDEPLPGSVFRVEFKPYRFKHDGEWFKMNRAYFYNRDDKRVWACNLVYFDSHFSLVAAPRWTRRKSTPSDGGGAMSDEERFEAGQVLYLERPLNGKWFRKGRIRLEDYIAERQEEARQYREQWLRAAEQERQKVCAEFEEWKKNHLNHEADDLRAEVERLRGKAIQFDLDQAGIESRAREAAELVDLRAEVARLKDERVQLAVVVQHAYRKVAEDQREACAERMKQAREDGPERLCRATPLVTEGCREF